MVNVWPESLPLPFVDYSGAAMVGFINSDLTSAVTQRRTRFRKTYGAVACTWQLGTAQKRAFETFIADTLGNGASAFSIDLRLPKNTELTNWMVKLGGEGSYEIMFQEGTWRASASLELIAPTLLPDAVDDPNAGLDVFMLGSDASSSDEPLIDSDGEEFFVLLE
jgi:hypothetical protein